MTLDDDDMTPEERRARAALQGLPVEAADAAFRARMRARFVGDQTRAVEATPRQGSRRWWLLAASIAIVAAVSALALTRAEPWRFVASQGGGFVTIDGDRVPITEVSRLAGRLVGGVRVETDADAELQLQGADAVVLVVTPGTEVQLPSVPGRWLSRRSQGAVTRGEVRGTTGPTFAGAEWQFSLPGAVVAITGTTFAVLRTDEGSCVCVLDGRVTMTAGAAATLVEPGRRRLLLTATGKPLDEPLRPMEQMKLEMLRDAGGALLRSGSRP
jgi:hypothetical protein